MTRPSLDFDSTWTKLADVNIRAKYLFYFKNFWVLIVAKMFDDDDEQDTFSPEKRLTDSLTNSPWET
jgi:hypothetical protein